MSNLDDDIIYEAASLLMRSSPRKQTTSLEVKTLLRHLGHVAHQSDVSSLLKEVSDSKGWYMEHVSENGNSFRVYSRESIQIPSKNEGGFQFR